MKSQYLLLLLLLSSMFHVIAQDETRPGIAILSNDGTVTYQRDSWQTPLNMQIGSILELTDLVRANKSDITVLCPDGSVRTFFSYDLLAEDILSCPSTNMIIIGQPGELQLFVTMGGRQDPTIPYLISPRATLLRTNSVTLSWNAPLRVLTYDLTIRGNETYTFEDISAAEVTIDDIASFLLPFELQSDIIYTVEICALFEDLRSGCTTDPGWSTGSDISFIYRPFPDLDTLIDDLTNTLYNDRPAELIATALLLSQPDENGRAYNDEAIKTLQTLIQDFPNSPQALSPETYNLLGKLYQNIALPIDAYYAYVEAEALAEVNTEAAATALLGQAVNIVDGAQSPSLYDRALDHYAGYMAPSTFDDKFEQVCKAIGDICLDLTRCQNQNEICLAWIDAD